MSLLNELMIYITTKDRLELLKFRQRVIKQYGHDRFKKLLDQANKELENEV